MIFRIIDRSADGSVSRRELYKALRRFKVPTTKAEFAQVARVIDPDQSGDMTMEEWIDFMMATDEDLEEQTREAADVQCEINAAKGDGFSAVFGEGAQLLCGDKVGGVVGGMAEKVADLTDVALDVFNGDNTQVRFSCLSVVNLTDGLSVLCRCPSMQKKVEESEFASPVFDTEEQNSPR
eukprot:COSAG01_NODE_10559_length_2133_cov_1.785644_3_plen_180_part_00